MPIIAWAPRMQQPRHVFIVTSGRTGSTLLLGMLNAHDGVHIQGENFGFLYYQYKSLEALKLSLAHLGSEKTAQSPFLGADLVDIGAMEKRIHAMCRDIVDGAAPPSTIIGGFKEVRYDMPDLDDYLAFLRRVFPSGLFVFLLRDTAEVITSGFWKTMPAVAATAKVVAMQGRFRSFAEKHPEFSTMIDYRDLVQPGETLKGLFARLAIAYDGARIAKALGTPYSYDPESVRFHDNTRLQLAPRHELQKRLRFFNFDRLAPSEDGASIAVGGVLLPHQGLPAIGSVFAVPSHKGANEPGVQMTGETGLPSPGIGQKFSDDPRSAVARFKLWVDISVGSADIYFQQGNEVVMAGQLTMHDPNARHFLEPNTGFTEEPQTSER